MRVLDPGHLYELVNLDDDVADVPSAPTRIYFVKRIGDKFPGNTGPSSSGTITQEVIRTLIDRTEYVNGQRPHDRNQRVMHHLREALRELELRAAEERFDMRAVFQITIASKPELQAICSRCGHIWCRRSPCS